MKHPKELVWFGPTYSYSGYAQHNRAMIFELLKLGWDIRLIPSESSIPEHLIGKDKLLELTKNTKIDRFKSISLNLIPPPALPYYGAYNILFTTLESRTVHEGFFRRCMLFQEVWVPCLENLASMIQAGWPKNRIQYCPEGVYYNFWSEDTTESPKYKSPYFTFFYNGDWSFRKGLDILIRAYAKAFMPTDPVRLLLLTHYQGHGHKHSERMIRNEMVYITQKYGISRLPRIEFIFEHIPDPDMPSIFKCADVYVCPTRGEAWGLPIIQAMSCGIPSIVPKWGGQTDYCTRKTSWLIDTEKFDIMDNKVNLEVDFYREQEFCFPKVEHLIKLMRYAFEHPDEVKKKGKIASKYVRENFGWERSGKIANDRLEEIYESRAFSTYLRQTGVDKRVLQKSF